jgi:hypothetical protein
MAIRILAGAVLSLALVGCGKHESPSGPEVVTTDRIPRVPIDTRAFLPLDLGRAWVLRNEAFPERITTIRVVRDSDGALALVFDKNHPGTYHGWGNDRLVWRLHECADGLYAENELGGNDSDSSFGPYPDDERYDIATGAWRASIWFIGAHPAQIVMPWRVRDGQTVTVDQAYAYADSSGTRAISHQQWTVTWRLAGALLVLRFDELTVESGTWIHEDWRLERGVGIVEIAQWMDAGRTSLIRRVAQR